MPSSAENHVNDQSSNDSESGKIESLENELKIAKEMIQSLKMERRKLRADKNGETLLNFLYWPLTRVKMFSFLRIIKPVIWHNF